MRNEELAMSNYLPFFGSSYFRAIPHNSRLTAQAPLRRLRHGICVAKMLDNVGLRYPHRASGTKAPRTLRPLPLLRFAVSATGGAHLCSIQYYLRFWLSICRTALAVSALRIMWYCLNLFLFPAFGFRSAGSVVSNLFPVCLNGSAVQLLTDHDDHFLRFGNGL